MSKVKAWAEQYNLRFKPITEAQKEYHARHSTTNLIVYDKSGDCTCPRCGKEMHIGKTKHAGSVQCPHCKQTFKVQHAWRMSQYLETINWMVIPKVFDGKVLCLRYVLAYQRGDHPMQVYEAARMFIDEKHKEPEYYCKSEKNTWVKGKGIYFRTPCFFINNRFFCMYAYEYPKNFFKEIDKMNCFKYYSSKNYYSEKHIPSQLYFMVKTAGINEKLCKVGMGKLVADHRDFFNRSGQKFYSFNYKATSLMDMLGLNKQKYDALKHNTTWEMMMSLKGDDNINFTDLATAGYDYNRYKKVGHLAKRVHASFNKMYKYIAENIKDMTDYDDYLDTIEKLGYNLADSYYSMPKNFVKADKKAIDEYVARFESVKLKSRMAKDLRIKEISDKLRAMPNLKDFLGGSDGLLVYVPESSSDLIAEGKALRNCIGTYVDRIAEGKTNVFFIRRLNDPTAPFVAMEICNGEIIQIREDHNKAVVDTQILDFCHRFADALKAA